MKRISVLSLVLVLFFSSVSAKADGNIGYVPALGMTINELVNKYNMIQSPLGAPYKKLKVNASIENRGAYTCAVFPVANNTGIEMLAITLEKNKKNADAGADGILLICYKDSELLPFFSVAKRITSMFSTEIFGVNYSGLYIGDLISAFYESGAMENDQYYYIQLGSDSKYYAAMYYVGGMYFFVLTALDCMSIIMEG